MVVLVGNFVTGLKHETYLPVPHFNHKPRTRRMSAAMMSSPQRCKLDVSEDKKTIKLTLTGISKFGVEDPHHLDPDLIKSITELLDEAKSEAVEGSVLITTARGNHFSRGFCYSEADGERHEASEEFKNLVKDLICLPMPTIAAVNGYASGAGLMLAICHDYMTMKPKVSLRSEHLFYGTSLPPYFAALLRSKVSSPVVLRDLVLRDLQFNSQYAARIGLVDKSSEDEPDFYKQAKSLAQTLSNHRVNGEKLISGDVYAQLRKAMLPDLCKLLNIT